MEIIIEESSGFCFGVVSAIDMVEKKLKEHNSLYCLGEIVHNDMEVKRLSKMGLKTINHDEMKYLKDTSVMIRAHGEPPSTYEIAKKNNITIIDATCPIVLKLQKDVKNAYNISKNNGGQLIIFGKKGHAEVIGLLGQTDDNAVIISNYMDLDKIDYSKPISIFSQTTMSLEDYNNICKEIAKRSKKANPNTEINLSIKNSICKRVCSRTNNLKTFAQNVDIIIFVSGEKSSNGVYLYNLCKTYKEKTYFISNIQELNKNWFKDVNRVGICGATSTPMWLLKMVEQEIMKLS